MLTTLCLLRHGRATGQGPEAELTPAGQAEIVELAQRLAAEGFRPAAAFSSPYARARGTLELLLERVAPALEPLALRALEPEAEPEAALAAIEALAPAQGAVLVVTHMPLVARLAQKLMAEDIAFRPGMFVEIALAQNGRSGRQVRCIEPRAPRG